MSKEMTFTIFCIESYKRHRAMTGRQVAEMFGTYGVFGYLREFYDVLHTASESYINSDIDEYLARRGA